METIIQPIKRYVEYKAISYVNTGNKMEDSQVLAILSALIVIIFTIDWLHLIERVRLSLFLRRGNTIYAFNDKTMEHYHTLYTANPMVYSFESFNCISDTQKFFKFLISLYPSIFKARQTQYYESEIAHELAKKQRTIILRAALNKNIYIDIANNDYLTFLFNDKQFFGKFLTEFNGTSDDGKNDSGERKIHAIHCVTKLFPDRNFDSVVSRHKKNVVRLLDTFIESNKNGKSAHNGFSPYNRGIIFYGEPGCGKTLFQKAICNYVGRDGYLLDLRSIKSIGDFNKYFNDQKLLKTKVLILDELDCIQGVIKKRDGSAKTERLLNILENKRIEVLEKMTDCMNQETKKVFKAELDNINAQIEKEKNSFTLETLLTSFDGMAEVRDRIIIATTNHLDLIDPALLRVGRFDLKVELTRFNNDECHELLRKMFEGNDDLSLLANVTFKEEMFTPAEIINMACLYGNLKTLLEKIKEKEGKMNQKKERGRNQEEKEEIKSLD